MKEMEGFEVIEDAGPVPSLLGNHGKYRGIQWALESLPVGGAVAVPLKEGKKWNSGWLQIRAARNLGIPRLSFIGRTIIKDDGTSEYRIYRVEADGA